MDFAFALRFCSYHHFISHDFSNYLPCIWLLGETQKGASKEKDVRLSNIVAAKCMYSIPSLQIIDSGN